MAWPSAKSNRVAYSMGDHFFTVMELITISGSQQHKLAYFVILNFILNRWSWKDNLIPTVSKSASMWTGKPITCTLVLTTHFYFPPIMQLVIHTKLWEGLKNSIAIIIIFWNCSIIKIELMWIKFKQLYKYKNLQTHSKPFHGQHNTSSVNAHHTTYTVQRQDWWG